MKKIFGLIAALILVMGCDDGEMSFNTFDFSNGTTSTCADSDIYYKINGTEVLIINLAGDPLINVATPHDPLTDADIPRQITIGSTNTITYRNYDGTPTANSMCSFPAPASPGVLEEWSGVGTIEVITDVVRNSTGQITGFSNKITLRDISFTKDGETTRIVDNEFGSIIVPIGFTFNFGVVEEGEDPVAQTCDDDENDLIFKRNGREALLLDLDLARFSDNVAGTTETINISDLTDEGVVFLVYDGTTTIANICDVISPVSPHISERWAATSGTININTVPAPGSALVHQIRFNNMVFTKVSDLSGQTFTIPDLLNLGAGVTEYYFGVYVP
jgi:hypothetical protein